MCTYSTFMYMPGTLKADHWRVPTGTPNCHIVAGVKTPVLFKTMLSGSNYQGGESRTPVTGQRSNRTASVSALGSH